MGTKNSRLQGFYQLNPFERLQMVKSFDGLCDEDMRVLHGGQGTLSVERADKMIENVIGTYNLPLGIATNFQINGRDYLIPMVVEEPSIVAGASYAAKLVREGGGFAASHSEPLMIGQVQIVGVKAPQSARHDILSRKDEILSIANAQSRSLVALGGGARDLEVHLHPASPMGPMLVAHLIVDCRDAMGANAINSMCEAVAPLLEQITGGKVYLRILSNLSDRRLARARCVVPPSALARDGMTGEEVIEGIMWAYAFAAVDPYRAATHNKGILTGIDPVIVATGNDWRAIEAGAHAYAAIGGRYTSLTRFSLDDESRCLIGTIELPLAVGSVGGATRVHPTVQTARAILGDVATSASRLAGTMAAVGLAQNTGALKAMVTDGIQHGHMRLHARQVALAAGASADEVAAVADVIVAEKNVKESRARAVLEQLRTTIPENA